jgi:hypothetical protein
MMWGDIIIGMHGQEPFTVEQASELPQDMKMVFWNYNHFDRAFYADTIAHYRKLGFEPLVAPGLWNWGRLWPSDRGADGTAALFVKTAVGAGVREALLTMWGDDGNEAPFAASWPGLCQFVNLCWDARTRGDAQFAQVEAVCGTSARSYQLPGRLDLYPGRESKSVRALSNFSKAILWDDPILGTFCTHLKSPLGKHFAALASEIETAAKTAHRNDKTLFAYATNLARVLTLKVDLNMRAREGYQKKDRKVLATVAADAAALEGLVRGLLGFHTSAWMSECKPYGLEVIQNRYGGQMVRLREMRRRIDRWIKGQTESIPEWDEKPQKFWADPATVRATWGQTATMCYLRDNATSFH